MSLRVQQLECVTVTKTKDNVQLTVKVRSACLAMDYQRCAFIDRFAFRLRFSTKLRSTKSRMVCSAPPCPLVSACLLLAHGPVSKHLNRASYSIVI